MTPGRFSQARLNDAFHGSPPQVRQVQPRQGRGWLVIIILAAGALAVSVATGGLWKALQPPVQKVVLQSVQSLRAAPEAGARLLNQTQQKTQKAVEADQLKLKNLEVAQAWSDLIMGNLEKLIEIILGIAGVAGLIRARKGGKPSKEKSL